MERYQDPLANVTDEDLARSDEPILYPDTPHLENPANYFRYDDYEWDGFYVPGQVPLILSQGFFTFVGENDLEKLDGRKPCANVWRDPATKGVLRVYAVLRDVDKRVYLHRFLQGATARSDIVDHVNRLPLDNRSDGNLWKTNPSINASNRFYQTSVERGVRTVGKKFQGQISFEGKMHFSKVFATQAEARAWFREKYAEFYGANPPKEKPLLNYPVFPPRKPEAPDLLPLGTARFLVGAVVDNLLDTF